MLNGLVKYCYSISKQAPFHRTIFSLGPIRCSVWKAHCSVQRWTAVPGLRVRWIKQDRIGAVNRLIFILFSYNNYHTVCGKNISLNKYFQNIC